MKRTRIDVSISRRLGRGWLVLVGGTTDAWRGTEAIDRAAIDLMPPVMPVAFVPAANCPPEYGASFLATYRRYGAPDGYVVPIADRASAHDDQNAELLRRAGLIYFGGGDTTALLASMSRSPAVDAVGQAYERGAVIVGMSAGAIALSARGVSLGAGVLQGWGWLPELLVSVHHGPHRARQFEQAMRDFPDHLGVTLPEDAALALGSDGGAEAWGEEAIELTHGANYRE